MSISRRMRLRKCWRGAGELVKVSGDTTQEPGSTRREVLTAFSGALGREVCVFTWDQDYMVLVKQILKELSGQED